MTSLLLLLNLWNSTGTTKSMPGVERVLWEEPGPRTVSDWTWGPGGEARAPRPPFRFIKENLGGTNAKIEVRDASGSLWIVKFGGEVHSAVFASRLLYATGYAAEPAYYVDRGVAVGAAGLKRAKHFVARDGSFHEAVFRLRDDHLLQYDDDQHWSWTANPFLGTRQLSGLKILMMLSSNWDAKDDRDGKGSNTAVFRRPAADRDTYLYSFTDWGATFGRWGGFFKRTKWDESGYRRQTRRFVRESADGELVWGYRGKHGRDLAADISREDLRWLLGYLSLITDEEIRAGLSASGAGPETTGAFTTAVIQRMSKLRTLAREEREE